MFSRSFERYRLPFQITSPHRFSSPQKHREKVDLPAPLLPMMPTMRPAGIVQSCMCRIDDPWGYAKRNCFSSSSVPVHCGVCGGCNCSRAKVRSPISVRACSDRPLNSSAVYSRVIFRFFPTVSEEYQAIRDAMKMRGIRFGGKNPFLMVEYRLVPLIVSVVKIGDELSAAALTRGLGAPGRRTNLCRIGFHAQDLMAALFCVACFALFLLQPQIAFWGGVRG